MHKSCFSSNYDKFHIENSKMQMLNYDEDEKSVMFLLNGTIGRLHSSVTTRWSQSVQDGGPDLCVSTAFI